MRPLAYLSDAYPKITQTFTRDEVRALHAAGVPLTVWSLHAPAPSDPELDERDPPVVHLPSPWSVSVIAAALGALLRSPVTFSKCLLAALFPRSDPFLFGLVLRGPIHVAWGAWVAARLRRDVNGDAHVHAQFTGAACTVAWVASRLTRASFSFTAHSEWGMPILARKMRDAARVIAISEHERGRLLERAPGVPPGRVVVHRLGVDTAALSARRKASADRRSGPVRLLAVGGFGPTKGHDVLVRAARLLVDRKVEFRLDVVGDGPLRPGVERLVAELRIGDVVTLPAWQPHAAVLDRLADADVVVLACRCTDDGDVDGIPVALMEGMAAGKPTVSTGVGGIPELIEDGRTGRLVDPDRPDALATALEELIADPSERDRLGAAAAAFVAEHHDAERSHRRFTGIVTELLATN